MLARPSSTIPQVPLSVLCYETKPTTIASRPRVKSDFEVLPCPSLFPDVLSINLYPSVMKPSRFRQLATSVWITPSLQTARALYKPQRKKYLFLTLLHSYDQFEYDSLRPLCDNQLNSTTNNFFLSLQLLHWFLQVLCVSRLD